MNPNHVVSLELAKKLKEVGYPQKGEFWWIEFKTNKYDLYDGHTSPARWSGGRCVAPLASELMERLPIDEVIRYVMRFLPDDKTTLTFLWGICKDCNALAKCYIYLKEQRLIK